MFQFRTVSPRNVRYLKKSDPSAIFNELLYLTTLETEAIFFQLSNKKLLKMLQISQVFKSPIHLKNSDQAI